MTTYVVYSSIAIASTPSLNEMSTITGVCVVRLPNHPSRSDFLKPIKPYINLDNKVNVPLAGEENPYIQSAHPNAIPKLYDIPLSLVNNVVHRDHRPRAPVPKVAPSADGPRETR